MPKAKGSAISPDLSANRMDMGIHHRKEPLFAPAREKEIKEVTKKTTTSVLERKFNTPKGIGVYSLKVNMKEKVL